MVTTLNMTRSYTETSSWLVITILMSASASASGGTTAGGPGQQTETMCNCGGQELTYFNTSTCSLKTTKLDLSDNKLTVLPAYMFTGLVHLKKIELNFNSIVFIDKHAFSGLLDLEVLHLTFNKLTYLHPDLILGNPSLRELHLKKNRIEIPECGPLLKSKSLRVLGLEWCGIDSLVQADTFSQLLSLDTLNLSGNSLNRVNATPFQPLIDRKDGKREIIKDPGNCSEAFRETIIQLRDQINFTDNCNVARTSTESPSSSIQPNTSREFVHSPFDAPFIIASTTTVTCVLVVILVVYVCFVQCTSHCRRRTEQAIEKRPRENTPPRDPERDPYNDGYLPPRTTPRTEHDDILALPSVPPAYLKVLPEPSHETSDLDDFPFKTRLERENSTTPLLRHGSHTSPDGYMKMDAAFNYPLAPSGVVDIDGTKESKELKNRTASLRSLTWVDNEKAHGSECGGSKQERPLPPVPARSQPSPEDAYQPWIATTTPLPLPTRNANARQHPLTILAGKLGFNESC